eukprot:CAMPEP_0119342948 /NCGR_PEP_ID=MMETSP1333-20130426/105829_1 /TAXON_ID=418940 /ORGANISM="Scyphosphaera apsteinii, Strain RCC1455" /LENGTH=80 /DNA_ID=CAMNT_0007355275 /DNA_START=65 /DNA_END=303 /DNA_ORIENTATION=+
MPIQSHLDNLMQSHVPREAPAACPPTVASGTLLARYTAERPEDATPPDSSLHSTSATPASATRALGPCTSASGTPAPGVS